ncbi:MAG: class I SAM-dependent methyltransferase [Candidatus Roizmanbacteria bacterium]|nr:class I SAM-dependent methyltransferase [Candidatus Roizmanbacteria bacterium]
MIKEKESEIFVVSHDDTESRIQAARRHIEEKLIPTTCRSWNHCASILSLPPADLAEFWAGKKILDVGSGDKFETPDDRFPGATVYALDPLFPQVQPPHSNYFDRVNKAHIVRPGTIIEIPFDDNAFDLVMSTHCIQHIQRKYWYRSLLEMMRVMKPDGEIRVFPYHKEELPGVTYGLHESGFDWEPLQVPHSYRVALSLKLAPSEWDVQPLHRTYNKTVAWKRWHDLVLPHDPLRDDYDPFFSAANSVNAPSAIVTPLVNKG